MAKGVNLTSRIEYLKQMQHSTIKFTKERQNHEFRKN